MTRTFTRASAGWLPYALSVLTILLLLGFLTLSMVRLARIQHEMRAHLTANMVWVTHQAQIESLKLDTELQRYALGLSDKETLNFRYQLLLSRLKLLQDGPQSRALQDLQMDVEVFRHVDAVTALEALLTADDDRTTAASSRIHHVLVEFSAVMAEASNLAMIHQWEQAGSRLDRYRGGVLTVILLMAGIWIGSAYISIRLLLAQKKALEAEIIRERERDLQRQLDNERHITAFYRYFGEMVSHQFRTPLTLIDASMQRLLRAGDGLAAQEVVRRATKARAATLRLSLLIDRILQAGRDLAQTEPQLGQHSLSSLVRQSVADVERRSGQRRFEFTDESPSDLCAVCDPTLTLQILDNLLTNAIKYSTADVPIHVRVEHRAPWVTCTVHQRGSPIAPGEQAHIFERFFRSMDAADTPGTGLGLYIAHQLTELQGGRISVMSDAETGTAFELALRQAPCAQSGSQA